MKNTVNVFILFVLLAFSCSSFSNMQTKESELLEELEILKILADAKSVYQSIEYLFCPMPPHGKIKFENKEFVLLKERMDLSIDEIKKIAPTFHMNSLPFNLKITEENQKELSTVCLSLLKDIEEVRVLMLKEKGTISLKYLEHIIALSSQNVGDYYISVSLIDKMHNLVDHPLKNTIEVLYFNESTFGDADKYFDQSLWQLVKHCPNLQVLSLGSTRMNTETLDKINLHELKKLKVLILYSNKLTELPVKITEMEQLLMLDLSGNYIKEFPDLSKLKNLKFLKINGNAITEEVFEAIKKMLPNTEIDAGKRFR